MKEQILSEISRILNTIDDTWVLNQIYRFMVNMTREGANSDEQ